MPISLGSWEKFDYFHDLILSEEFKRFGSYGYSDGLMGLINWFTSHFAFWF